MPRQFVEQIYHQYKKLIKHIAYSRLQNEHLAEEVVHEAMLAVISHTSKLQDRTPEELKAFLYLVTRNICNDILRKELRRKAEPLELLWEQPQSGGDPQERLGEQVILDYILKMPEPYRDVLELTAFFGFTAKEAAKLLHITPAACRKRLERARSMLREKITLGEEEESHV